MAKNGGVVGLLVFAIATQAGADCDAYHYISGSLCVACPANTRRFPTSAADVVGTSISQCLCERGYFSRTVSGGTTCEACPAGGICEGELASPYPARGFYGDSTVDLVTSSGPAFLPCLGPHACRGAFQCGEEWEGVLCASPTEGRFEFGALSVECPTSPDSALRFGSRRTEFITAAIIVAAFAVIVLLSRASVCPDLASRRSVTAWHCLQLLAMAVRIRHVPWPPLLHASLLLVSDSVLFDLRPLGRLYLGCDMIGAMPDADAGRAFFLEWAPTLVAVGLAVVLGTAARIPSGTAFSAPHAFALFRLVSPVLVLASCETLACRTVI